MQQNARVSMQPDKISIQQDLTVFLKKVIAGGGGQGIEVILEKRHLLNAWFNTKNPIPHATDQKVECLVKLCPNLVVCLVEFVKKRTMGQEILAAAIVIVGFLGIHVQQDGRHCIVS